LCSTKPTSTACASAAALSGAGRGLASMGHVGLFHASDLARAVGFRGRGHPNSVLGTYDAVVRIQWIPQCFQKWWSGARMHSIVHARARSPSTDRQRGGGCSCPSSAARRRRPSAPSRSAHRRHTARCVRWLGRRRLAPWLAAVSSHARPGPKVVPG
jgi:hypothetical protein